MFRPFTASLVLSLMSCAAVPQSAPEVTAPQAVDLTLEAYTYFHENPELGGKEVKAQAFIISRLQAMPGVEIVSSKLAPTAVIGVFDTGRPGPVTALRAEMDARPLTIGTVEPVDHSPRSQIDGVMHNCGHDAHAAMLLGAAEEITSQPEAYTGKIIFLFQPAEEIAGGADDIVDEGLLSELGVEAIFAQHVAPNMSVGEISITPSGSLAGSNYFDLVLTGKGSHAAAPYDGADMPLVAARFALELSQLPARRADIANDPFVFSVAQLVADAGTKNVIPTEAKLSGTIRAFKSVDEKGGNGLSIRELVEARISALAAAYDVEASFSLRTGSPPTVNNDQLFQALVPGLQARVGEGLEVSTERGMFSEDFAYYTAVIPALYFGLGVSRDGLGSGGVHTPDFTLHPDALTVGREFLVDIVDEMNGL